MIISGAHSSAAAVFNPQLQAVLTPPQRTPLTPAQVPQALQAPLSPAQAPQAAPASLARGLPAHHEPRPDPGRPRETQDGSLRWDPTILKDQSWETTGHDGAHYKFEMSPDDSATIEIFDKAGDQGKRLGSMVVSYDTLGWSRVEFRGAQGEHVGSFRVSELFEPGTFRLRDAQDKVLQPGQGTGELKLVESHGGGSSLVRFAGKEFYLSGKHFPQDSRTSDSQPVETLSLSGDNWSLHGEGNYRRGNQLEVTGFDKTREQFVLLSPHEFKTPEDLARSAASHMLLSDRPAQEVYDSFIRSGVGGYGTPGKESAELKTALDEALRGRQLNSFEEVRQEHLRNLAEDAAYGIDMLAQSGGDAAASYDRFVTSGMGGFGTEGTASTQLKQALDAALIEKGVTDTAVLKKMGIKNDDMIELLQGKKDYDGDKVVHFEGQPGEYEEDVGEVSNLEVTYKTFFASGGQPGSFVDYLNEVAGTGKGKAEFLIKASQGWYDETDGKPKNDGSNVWSPFEHTTIFGWHVYGDADNRNEFLSQLKLEDVPLPA